MLAWTALVRRIARRSLSSWLCPARLSRATAGFQALGDLAEPAIPDLLTLVEKSPGFVPSALAAIGPAAVPALPPRDIAG